MKKLTYVQAIREAVKQEMDRDSSVFYIGEDVVAGVHGISAGLHEIYGDERIRNCPISEAAFTGMGVGAAAMGKRPIVEIMYSTFLYIAMDQIINQASKMRYMFAGQASVPMVISAVTSYRGAGAAHHSDTVYPMFLGLPGIKVVYPSGVKDAKGLFAAAVRDNNPVLFLHGALLLRKKEEIPDGEYVIPLGKANVIQEGHDVTIIGVGNTVEVAVEAAKKLEGKYSVEVIDPRTVNPLDMDTILASVEKTGRLVTVEDIYPTGGVGAEVAAQINEKLFGKMKAPLARVTRGCVPMPFSPLLEKMIVTNADKVVSAVERIMS